MRGRSSGKTAPPLPALHPDTGGGYKVAPRRAPLMAALEPQVPDGRLERRDGLPLARSDA